MKYNKENLVGRMRFDFNDGENSLCNSWFPSQEITQEDINEIQPIVNNVMFDIFFSFSKIIEECNGEGYSNTKLLERETDHFDYCIKLIPVMGDYNGYIFVYRK